MMHPLGYVAVLRRMGKCAPLDRFPQEKQEGNPEKLLTRRSAFIHDVSYPFPVP